MAGYDDTTNTDASFRLSTPPRDLVWGVLASLVILALAAAFFGFQNVRPGDIIPTGWVPGSGPAAGVGSASPAVAIPKDDRWSTLNGPQVLEPEAPKPARVSHKDDEDPADAAAPMPDPNAADTRAPLDAAPATPGDTKSPDSPDPTPAEPRG
jgi:hypothetical protein